MRAIVALIAAMLALAPLAVMAQDIQITADNFVVNETTREAVFTGNVIVVHPSVTLRAPKVTVIYGAGGTSDVQSFDAEGPVDLTTSEQEAKGDRAVFDPKAQMLYLTGNVTVVNAGGTLTGPELVVDIANNTSKFTGGTGGRVTGVFTSQ